MFGLPKDTGVSENCLLGSQISYGPLGRILEGPGSRVFRLILDPRPGGLWYPLDPRPGGLRYPLDPRPGGLRYPLDFSRVSRRVP